jgi:pimeloyl-ACP methyl ester carboxylesterase
LNVHEFGTQNHDILLMFHGSCMVWDMYEEAIELLSRHFHVVIPSLPGHDLETDEDFTSVEQIAVQTADWLLARGYDTVACLYGLSMGGSLVLRMLADGRVTVRRAIIDGGITPYQLPWAVTRLIAVRDYLMVQIGRRNKKILEWAFPPEKYTREGVDYMHKALRHMSSKTVWRVFESCNNYSMPIPIPEIQTGIEYWYGEKEKKARAWDIAYVKKNFPAAQFREIPGADHGEYCMIRQRAFADDVTALAQK